MKFWKIHVPRYSDYHRTHINGKVTYAYSLPGIRCESCQSTWMDAQRVLPFTLPAELKNRLIGGRPLTVEEFTTTQTVLADTLPDSKGYVFRPGENFHPAVLDVPTVPRADVLWGGWSPIVSERIRQRLEDEQVSGVSFLPVTIGQIGKKEANLPPPIPSSGEPEEIMKGARAPSESVGARTLYSSMIPTAKSKWPDYVTRGEDCEQCGRVSWSLPESPEDICKPGDKSSWHMHEGLWDGHDVFLLTPSSQVIVTDRVRKIIEKSKATNVAFERMDRA